MDMFRCIPAWHDEPSLHGYCSNNNSINNDAELLISQWSMCNYYDDSAPSLGSFLPEEEEDQLITANQSDTNHFSSSTSKEEQDEDNEGGEGEDRRKKEQKEGRENRKDKVEEGKRWKRQKVKISKDPQSVAARNRRHRISQKMRILKKLVPGGMKMDTASMLDEAVQYLKLLKAQVSSMQAVMNALENAEPFPFPMPMPMPMEYYN